MFSDMFILHFQHQLLCSIWGGVFFKNVFVCCTINMNNIYNLGWSDLFHEISMEKRMVQVFTQSLSKMIVCSMQVTWKIV